MAKILKTIKNYFKPEVVDVNMYYNLGKRDMLAETFMVISGSKDANDVLKELKELADLVKDNAHAEWFIDNYEKIKIPRQSKRPRNNQESVRQVRC